MPPIKKDETSGVLYRVWDVEQARATVVLIHGLCSHSGRWESLVEAIHRAGIAAYAIELQGFGETSGQRGHIPSFSRYYADILSLIALVRKHHPDNKVFLLGESMGGLIAFVLASIIPHIANGVICYSPAFKSKLSFSTADTLKIFFALLYRRSKTFEVPFTAAMCTRDEEWQTTLDQDPLAPRRASAQMLVNIVAQQRCALSVLKKISVPVLIQLSGGDRIVDARESKKIFRKLVLEDKTLIDYPEYAHALSVDSGRELVFMDTLAWIVRHL